jgi:hypothetical protein
MPLPLYSGCQSGPEMKSVNSENCATPLRNQSALPRKKMNLCQYSGLTRLRLQGLNGNGWGFVTIMNKKELKFLIACITVLGVLALCRSFVLRRKVEEAKPYLTYNHLMFVAAACDKYKAKYGVFPSSLMPLHAFRADLNDPWTKDAWGRDVIAVPYNESSGFGEILSYGRDGKAGGVGKDGDLEVRFPIEVNAGWNKKMAEETEKSRLQP